MECLEKVHITKLKNKLTSQLSGGETQKVAICRALLNNPKIIIADEPTGNLDPMSSIEIMEILKEINKNGNTILVATHDFDLLKKYGNRFMKCTNGNIELIEKKNLKLENIYK
jgi:cell division transport system ATP-binding protein